MKVIISHDVDHVTAWEHKKDLMIPKFAVRSFIETGLGYVSMSEFINRLVSITKNNWQNIEELMRFDRENDIPSAFFIAVSKGRNLYYRISDAELWIAKIGDAGFEVGLHGIAFDDHAGLKVEYDLFKRLSGSEVFGIRIHDIGTGARDVSLTSENLCKLGKVGYLFSSNVFGFKDPFKVGNLWEFPIQIMDTHMFHKKRPWQDQTFEEVKDRTKKSLNDAYSQGLHYFNILFHDFYFSKGFRTWREWYIWFIHYCKSNGLHFVDYKGAVQELERERQTTTSVA